ncbi:transposase [Streptomyces sp. NPDC058751]|uniref:transposase n=1 Tax=Streptomyces sp. NPDC058751 TaxID=3346623 RepID=UPI0036C5A5D7
MTWAKRSDGPRPSPNVTRSDVKEQAEAREVLSHRPRGPGRSASERSRKSVMWQPGPGSASGHGPGNSRNGTSLKAVLTDVGAVAPAVPRHRDGEFEPRMVPKNARRLAGFDDRVLSLRARGMSVRDIRSHLARIYGRH